MSEANAATAEASVLSDVRLIFRSPLLKSIREAHARNVETKVQIGKYYVQFEPGIPAGVCSAMTDFEGNGFTMARDAFKSEDEFKKTLLQEVYRLRTSIARGTAEAGHVQQRAETDAASQFAEHYFRQL